MAQDFFELQSCRICGGRKLIEFLDLGKMPLVNDYPLPTDKGTRPEYPVTMLFCKDCSLSQLTVVVDPKVLYSDYHYFSSVSRTFQAHCADFAKEVVTKRKLGEKDLVAEIASNDGCLLSQFHQLRCKVVGIEPATNLANVARGKGLPAVNQFWGPEAAEAVKKEYGNPSVILATNVLAHVHDVHGFIKSVADILKPDGAFIFEVPYMVNFMNHAEFDTAYHEHLSYFLVKPLKIALEKNGMKIVEVQEFDIHGGSIRVTAELSASSTSPSSNVTRFLEWEEGLGLYEEATYLRFASHVSTLKEELTTFVHALKSRGKKIAAYGASAKGNVLLNYCGLGSDVLEYVVDDTPAKQGKLYARGRLPIVNREHLLKQRPDYLLLLAWNFVDELVKNTKDYQTSGGRYIVPIPSLKII